ncbi:hypothetical protein F3J09_10345 [Bacillus sp. Ab-1751]|uniref:hypothetical protein n=1 Tax=Bacillus sp. Ab-1751 TaxID=2608326 RepID=UPI0014206131|nr:hypothetical protein [Bacillus sp. Ab-1751]
MRKIFLHPLFISWSILILVPFILLYYLLDLGIPQEFNQEQWPKTEEAAKRNVDIIIDTVRLPGDYAKYEIYMNEDITSNK